MKGGVDLTTGIMERLPAHLREVARAVGERFGHPIRFYHAKELPGSAAARAQVINGQPEVLLTGGLHTDDRTLAEELLHLQRWAQGHPGVQAEGFGKMREYGLVCVFLSGLIDEYAFFPQLEMWGYDRSPELERILQGYLTKWEPETSPRADRPPGPEVLDHIWICKLAVEYARAALLVRPSPTREAFLQAYNHPDRITGKAAGGQLVVAIRDNPNPIPAGTARLLDTCLRDVLRVPDGTYSIHFLP